MNERKYLDFTFWTKKNIKDKVIGIKLSQLFLERNDELKPEFWWGGIYKNKRIDDNTPNQFMNELLDFTEKYGILQKVTYTFASSERKSRDFIFRILFGFIPKMFSHLSFSISHEYFTSQERINKFLSISRELILLFRPFYAKYHDMSDSVNSMTNKQTMDVLNKIPRVYWGNYFGEMYLQKITDKKLESFEVFKNEKIGNGRFIQLTATPFDFNTKEFKEKQKRLEKIIGKKFLGYKEVKLPLKL